MDQHEWVAGCQRYYEENWLEPGNPEDGEWHDCHYPVPKCLGGIETVKLLKEHHAVQGVLQSEEFGRACVWGWERHYLSGQLLARLNHWLVVKITPMLQAKAQMTSEQRSELIRRANQSRTPEQRSNISRQAWASRTPEERSEIGLRAASTKTPEQRSEAIRRGRANMTPEQRSEITRKGWETRRLKRLAKDE